MQKKNCECLSNFLNRLGLKTNNTIRKKERSEENEIKRKTMEACGFLGG